MKTAGGERGWGTGGVSRSIQRKISTRDTTTIKNTNTNSKDNGKDAEPSGEASFITRPPNRSIKKKINKKGKIDSRCNM